MHDHSIDNRVFVSVKNEEGITISRRTVTKYREAMHIPSSYQRANTKWMSHELEQTDDKEGLE